MPVSPGCTSADRAATIAPHALAARDATTMQQKRALITGVTGQDGAYLAELLLAKGYEVHGLKRRSSSFNTERIDHLYHELDETRPGVRLHYGDLTDSLSLLRVIRQVGPDEIYNLAAQSHVAVSFEEPEYTANADGLGALRVLEAMRSLGLGDRCRSTRHRHRSCTDSCARRRNAKRHRSIRALRTGSPSCMRTGSA